MLGKLLMPKNKRFILGNAIFILATAAVLAIGNISPLSMGVVQGESTSYSIVFETDKNKIAEGPFSTATYTGVGVVLTELGNSVTFDFNSLYNPTNMWQTIKAGGYITNTQPITGMESITLTKNSSSANFKIYWSNTTTFSEDRSVLFDTSSALTVSTNFGGYLPNYVKISAIANSAISSGWISFSCVNEYPTVGVVSENTSMGTVGGSGIYRVGTNVTLNAYPNTGYSFVGWYDGETLVSSSSPYTFPMPYNNLSYVAKFSANSYVLTLTSNDINKGTVTGSGTYAYGAEVTATAIEISGNEFIGWYQSTTLKSNNLNYTFTMPYNTLSLEARFVTQYNVNVSSFDETLGTVSGGGAHGYTTSVTLTAIPNAGNWFVAWYDDSFNTISTNSQYTFAMPANNVTYYAEFSHLEVGTNIRFGTYPQSKVIDTTLIETLNTARGTLPTSSNPQSWTSYGYYISGAASSFMWYIDLVNGTDEYRGVYFTSYRPYRTTFPSSTTYTYQNNNGYTTGSVYWFKYEPITWSVLDVQSGKAFLMADLLLDSQDYFYSTSNRTINSVTVYPNNYKESHIRSWLNSNFYNTAFTNAEQVVIQTTTVDNSASSTGTTPNIYACANTSDKVLLLSYVEATNATYGLGTFASRQLKPSAYAQSQGAYTNTNTFGYWWTRSPDNYYVGGLLTRELSSDGTTSIMHNVDYASIGVVPALWISV